MQGHSSKESVFQSSSSGYNPDPQEPTYLFTKWKFSVYVGFVSITICQQRLLIQRCLQHDRIHSSLVLNKVTPF